MLKLMTKLSLDKTLIKLIKKKMKDNQRRQYVVIHDATKVTHFEFVYGQDAMFSIEVNLDAYRLPKKNDLSVVMHYDLMMFNIDEVTDKRVKIVKEMEKTKLELTGLKTRRLKTHHFKLKI
jgi:dihydroneopterin aldolase